MKATLLILTVLMLPLFAGCAADERACVDVGDCFKGELCYQSVCTPEEDVPPVGEDTMTPANNQGFHNQTPENNQSPNNQSTNNQSTNNQTSNNNPSNNTMPPDPPPPYACGVSPFESRCTSDDRTNEWPGLYLRDLGSIGCRAQGFETVDDFVLSEELCAREPRDIYNINYIECNDAPFMIEARLVLKTECDPTLFTMEVSGVGTTCAEPNERIQCDRPEPHIRRIRILMPEKSNAIVGSMYFYVEKFGADNVEFDYDLEIEVYR